MNGKPRRSASDLPASVPAEVADAARGEVAPTSYASARRAFRIIDRVSRGGEGLDAKALARAMGISTSTCYQLLNILIEEGYVSRLQHGAGYRLGPAVSLLYRRSRQTSAETVVGPVLDELARSSGRAALFGLLNENDDVVVAHVSVPHGSPPIGIPPGLRGPSHALALGKVQIAAGGVRAIDRYLQRHALDSMTPRTITDPVALEAHLKEAHARGFATESEEFAKNLYGVAVPVLGQGGEVAGGIGLAAVADPGAELARLVELARQAARQATASLSAEPQEGRQRRVHR